MGAASSLQPVVQAVLIALAVVVALAALYVYAAWLHGRRLHAAREPIEQFWRGLEKALVEHHQAAEDLVRAADNAGCLKLAERERAEAAVAAATLTGTPAQRARREWILHEAMAGVRAAIEDATEPVSLRASEALATYRGTWGQVDSMGRRYSELATSYNRMAKNPLFAAWTRRRGRGTVETFEAPQRQEIATAVVEVL